MDYETIDKENEKSRAYWAEVLPDVERDYRAYDAFLALAKKLSADGIPHNTIAHAARDVCHNEMSFASDTYLEREVEIILGKLEAAQCGEAYFKRKGLGRFIDMARARFHPMKDAMIQ